MNSLSTVLIQEIDRYNKLLGVIRNSLTQLQKAIKGFVVMSEELELVYTAFINNTVPLLWEDAAYPSLKSFSSWVKDLQLRCDFINSWMVRGRPKSYWLSGFFFQQGFLTGTLQNYARKYQYPIDHLSFEFKILPLYRDQDEVCRLTSALKFGEELEMDQTLDAPEDGVLVHGLYMDGCRWNDETMKLADSHFGVMISDLPMMHMQPVMDYEAPIDDYIAPLYKTGLRAGTLNTTGLSTNFVVAVALPSDQVQDYWIAKGAALLTMPEN